MFSKRPCWKNEEEYAHLKTETDLHVWAWEFLRRDEGYHKDYADFCSKSPEQKKQRFFDPPREKEETEEAWRYRCGVELGVRFCRIDQSVPKIISTLVDCEPFFDHVEEYEENGVGVEYKKINENFMVVVYDLTRGYDLQQKATAAAFSKRRKTIRCPHKYKYW